MCEDSVLQAASERGEGHRQRQVAASARTHGRTKDCGRSKVSITTFDRSHTLTTRYEPAALAHTLCHRRAAVCKARGPSVRCRPRSRPAVVPTAPFSPSAAPPWPPSRQPANRAPRTRSWPPMAPITAQSAAALSRSKCTRRTRPLPTALAACGRPHGALFAICRAPPVALAPAHQSRAPQALLAAYGADHRAPAPLPSRYARALSTSRLRAPTRRPRRPRPRRRARRSSCSGRARGGRATPASARRRRSARSSPARP